MLAMRLSAGPEAGNPFILPNRPKEPEKTEEENQENGEEGNNENNENKENPEGEEKKEEPKPIPENNTEIISKKKPKRKAFNFGGDEKKEEPKIEAKLEDNIFHEDTPHKDELEHNLGDEASKSTATKKKKKKKRKNTTESSSSRKGSELSEDAFKAPIKEEPKKEIIKEEPKKEINTNKLGGIFGDNEEEKKPKNIKNLFDDDGPTETKPAPKKDIKNLFADDEEDISKATKSKKDDEKNNPKNKKIQFLFDDED